MRIIGILFIFILLIVPIAGQTSNQQQKPTQPDDTLQLSTTVVQTDLMVVTKDGRFVDNLKRDQFELFVDGKPQPISFFDLVTSGTKKEQTQFAAANGENPQPKAMESPSREIGRSIFFFVDDVHLSPDSIIRTKKMLLDYINNQANSSDRVEIVTTSGQLGFLQQLCGNKFVLRTAIDRLSYREMAGTDKERPIMTEGQAIDLQAGDRDILDYFVTSTMKEFPGQYTKITAERYVKSRSSRVIQTNGYVTLSTMSSLESFLRDVSKLSGRKLAFFISDGFLVRNQSVDVIGNLNDVISRAGLAGVVFYTLDARGLTTGLPDASSNATADTTGQSLRGSSNAIFDAQDGLNSLAVDTGGRAIRNTNALGQSVSNVVTETSQYYILAWQWNQDEGYKEKVRKLQVKIKDHPELIVRMRQRMLEAPGGAVASNAAAKPVSNIGLGTDDKQVQDTIKASFPRTDLPLSLYVGFSKAQDQSNLVLISTFIPGGMIDAKESGNTLAGDLKLTAGIFDEKGKQVSGFKQDVPISVPVTNGQAAVVPDFVRGDAVKLSPGLYQIRVVARDSVSGLIGSAYDWVEVPNLSKGNLALSTPFLGESTDGSNSDVKEFALKVDKDFSQNSELRFISYVYNMSNGITGNARILHNNKAVATAKSRDLSIADGKAGSHITYGDAISLKGLPAGTYTLEVTVTDHSSNAKSAQEINFVIK